MLPVPYDRNRPHYTDGLCMKKKISALFTFPTGNSSHPRCCKNTKERERERVMTNEPLWVFLGHFFPWSSDERSRIDLSEADKCAVKFSLCSHLSVPPPPRTSTSSRRVLFVYFHPAGTSWPPLLNIYLTMLEGPTRFYRLIYTKWM